METETWTIAHVLAWTTSFLQQHGVGTPRLDAEVLLAEVLQVDRIYLYTHFDQPLEDSERAAYRAFVQRRRKREPVAYIVGHKEFYGRPFIVTPDVLIPRPETEHLVEAVLKWLQDNGVSQPRILDVGTGSGVVGITLALELPAAHVVATDISSQALDIAKRNAAGLGARVEFLQGDLFEPVSGTFDVVCSNPPYVEAAAALEPELAYEPAQALFAGSEGMDVIRRLSHAPATGLLAFEFGAAQRDAVIAAFQGHSVQIIHDLQNLPRIALVPVNR